MPTPSGSATVLPSPTGVSFPSTLTLGVWSRSRRCQADRDRGFAEPRGDRFVHRRVRPRRRSRHLPRLHREVGIDLRQREVARRLEVVEQALERVQMRVADGRGGGAVRGCSAGDALLEDDGRSGRRRRRSGRPEAEVVHLGGETLRQAVGRAVAAVDDLGPCVRRGSSVEAGRAAARGVAAVPEDVELGDVPTSRSADGVVTTGRVDAGPRRHGHAVAGRAGGAGEGPVGHVGDRLVGHRHGVGTVLPAIGPSIEGDLVPVMTAGAGRVVGDEPVLHRRGAAAAVPKDPLLPGLAARIRGAGAGGGVGEKVGVDLERVRVGDRRSRVGDGTALAGHVGDVLEVSDRLRDVSRRGSRRNVVVVPDHGGPRAVPRNRRNVRRPHARNFLPLGAGIGGVEAPFLGRRLAQHGVFPVLALRRFLGRHLLFRSSGRSRSGLLRRRLGCSGRCEGVQQPEQQRGRDSGTKHLHNLSLLSFVSGVFSVVVTSTAHSLQKS